MISNNVIPPSEKTIKKFKENIFINIITSDTNNTNIADNFCGLSDEIKALIMLLLNYKKYFTPIQKYIYNKIKLNPKKYNDKLRVYLNSFVTKELTELCVLPKYNNPDYILYKFADEKKDLDDYIKALKKITKLKASGQLDEFVFNFILDQLKKQYNILES